MIDSFAFFSSNYLISDYLFEIYNLKIYFYRNNIR